MNMLQALLNQARGGRAGEPEARNNEFVDERKEEDGALLPKVSTDEKKRMKVYCGLDENAVEEMFPAWFRRTNSDKNQDDKDKHHVLRELFKDCRIFKDVETPLYVELAKMIIKRDWSGQDFSQRPTMENAAKGLSPFAMIDFTDEEVAMMTQQDRDLEIATSVTVEELRKSKSKIRAVVPDSAEDFLDMLKRFTNLLFALFGGRCPLYIQMYDIVEALLTYQPCARKKFTHQTKASILWIILLQSRHFAAGSMQGAQACLGAFTLMQNQLYAKMTHMIGHAEIPARLLQPTASKAKDTPTTPARNTHGAGNGHPPRSSPSQSTQGSPQGTHWSKGTPFEDAMVAAKFPRLYRVCTYCGVHKRQLVPDPQICQNFYVTGQCSFPQCRFKHVRPQTKEEVDAITSKLKRFLDDPLGMNESK